jgi:hypothetical protein
MEKPPTQIGAAKQKIKYRESAHFTCSQNRATRCVFQKIAQTEAKPRPGANPTTFKFTTTAPAL